LEQPSYPIHPASALLLRLDFFLEFSPSAFFSNPIPVVLAFTSLKDVDSTTFLANFVDFFLDFSPAASSRNPNPNPDPDPDPDPAPALLTFTS
jgi:hypothetical protein